MTVWRRDVVSDVASSAHFGENFGENNLTERQRLIYTAIKDNGENTAKSLARMLNMAQRTVEREISYLRSHGYIDKNGTNNAIWEILK